MYTQTWKRNAAYVRRPAGLRARHAGVWLAGLLLGLSGSATAQSGTWSHISEYPVLTADFGLTGITAGPDGALWFTEDIGNKIGRISTAGVITVYPVPTAFSAPDGITAGPDGALWFTE